MEPFRISGKIAGFVFVLAAIGAAGAQSGDSNHRRGAQPINATAKEMLSVHNAVRARVKVPPLQWSNQLAAYAQKWADTLVAGNRLAHSPNSPYGENIYASSMDSTPSMAVKEWASEARNYDYRTNACSTNCGHYTQIVWRNTRKVGCGVARGPRREIWVCNYDPPGNFIGEWPY